MTGFGLLALTPTSDLLFALDHVTVCLHLLFYNRPISNSSIGIFRLITALHGISAYFFFFKFCFTCSAGDVSERPVYHGVTSADIRFGCLHVKEAQIRFDIKLIHAHLSSVHSHVAYNEPVAHQKKTKQKKQKTELGHLNRAV